MGSSGERRHPRGGRHEPRQGYARPVIEFGPYELDRSQGLTRDGAEVRLTPRALAVLWMLAERAGGPAAAGAPGGPGGARGGGRRRRPQGGVVPQVRGRPRRHGLGADELYPGDPPRARRRSPPAAVRRDAPPPRVPVRRPDDAW